MAKRTLDSYKYHLEHTVKNCCKGWIVLRDNSSLFPRYIIIPKRCESNFCVVCRADNLRRLRRQLFQSMNKDRWRLVTLTFPHQNTTPDEILSNCYTIFRKFTMRLKRKSPKLKYVRTLEIHKDGYPHLHCVFNQYVPYNYLKKSWNDVGGGIVDIRAAKKCEVCGKSNRCEHHPNKTRLNYKQAARYLTEEMEKRIQDPHTIGYPLWRDRIRTITTSRNFKIKAKDGTYTFDSMASNLYDAFERFRMLEDDAWQDNTPSPTWKGTSSSFIISANTAEHKRIIPETINPTTLPQQAKGTSKRKIILPVSEAIALQQEVGF